MTLRLTPEDEQALTLLAEAQGISKQEATVRAIHEAAARRLRRDQVSALGFGKRALRRPARPTRPVIEYLSLDDVLTLIDDLEVGPIHDIGLLDSAVHRPQVSVFGADAYASLDDKAAALVESLVRNPALVDGNKRIGWLATMVFYGLNAVTLDAPDDDAYDLVIAVASGTATYQHAAEQLARWH